jgi:hypothetical protein
MENTQAQDKKPKQQLHEIMVEMFAMIEEMTINEGQYLQFAEMFKQMNLNINRLNEIQQIIIHNVYYQRYVRNNTIKRKRLNEAQKSRHPDYILCQCGCYIHKDEQINHINTTLKHRLGLRNKKYASKYKNPYDQRIDNAINREVLLDMFCIRHIASIVNGERDELEI